MASEGTRQHIGLAIAYYGLCSSTLLIVNKVSLHILPQPTLLLFIQLWFAVIFVYALSLVGAVSLERLKLSTACAFAPVVLSFLATLFSNAKVLQYANVETFITFRSSTPLVFSACDYVFLGRELPSSRSVASLLLLVVSSAGYAWCDHGFDVRAYSWLAVWYVSFTTYEVVVRRMCDQVLVDNWTRVVYTNAMSGLILGCLLPFSGSLSAAVVQDGFKLAILALSCIIGVGVSHSAYVMRSACSATLSTVVGIVCKVITVIINTCVWDKHASLSELAFLLLGLVAGAFYVPPPLRAPEKTAN